MASPIGRYGALRPSETRVSTPARRDAESFVMIDAVAKLGLLGDDGYSAQVSGGLDACGYVGFA